MEKKNNINIEVDNRNWIGQGLGWVQIEQYIKGKGLFSIFKNERRQVRDLRD